MDGLRDLKSSRGKETKPSVVRKKKERKINSKPPTNKRRFYMTLNNLNRRQGPIINIGSNLSLIHLGPY